MPLDRSDRAFVPIHTGAKNRVRLHWAARTTARRTETKDGVTVNPHEQWGTWPTTEADLLAMLKAGLTPEEIAEKLQ